VSQTAIGLSRRRWLRLLPAIFITYSFAYVDRANYGFGAAAGMAHDLHIDAGEVSLLGALFFLGYFLFQISAQPMPNAAAPSAWCCGA
jgi:sugar phosphate permease